KKRLEETGRNQSWLAGEIEVSRQMVSFYANGKNIPKNDVLKRIFKSLDVPYSTLDDLLDNR
ncbi:MAG: helix-turn-helix transcriptional regulator, partial [Nanoarchaeota archaeon]